MTIHAFTDGASRGNPGESGIGVLLKDDTGNTLASFHGYIGRATNNVAEYAALLKCLRAAAKLECSSLIVHSDSELMVRQLSGSYKVKDSNLRSLYKKVQAVLSKAPYAFLIVHIERSQNREADHLANLGIDSKKRIRV